MPVSVPGAQHMEQLVSEEINKALCCNMLLLIGNLLQLCLANSKTVTIQPSAGDDKAVVLSTTKTKKQNAPAKLHHKNVMRKEFHKMAKAVKTRARGETQNHGQAVTTAATRSPQPSTFPALTPASAAPSPLRPTSCSGRSWAQESWRPRSLDDQGKQLDLTGGGAGRKRTAGGRRCI